MRRRDLSPKRLSRFGLLVPSITWNAVPSEIFPYGIIYGLLNFSMRPIILALLLVGFVFGALPIFFLGQFSALEFLVSIVAFVNSTAVLLVTRMPFEHDLFRKVIKWFLGFMLAFCFVQWLGILSHFTGWFQMLVPRGNLEALSDVRGVTGLSSEPSRAGYEFLTLLYAFFIGDYLISRNQSGQSRKREGWRVALYLSYFIVIAGLFLFMNKSLTAVAIFLLYAGTLYLTTISFSRKILFVIFGLFCLWLVGVLGFDLLSHDRIQLLLSYENLPDLWAKIQQASFHRTPVIWYSLLFLFEHPFGAGFGNYAYAQALYQPEAVMHLNRLPWGLQLLLETGFLYAGIVLFVSLYLCFRAGLLRFLWPIILVIIFIGDPGNTVPFLAICYIFCVNESIRLRGANVPA